MYGVCGALTSSKQNRLPKYLKHFPKAEQEILKYAIMLSCLYASIVGCLEDI